MRTKLSGFFPKLFKSQIPINLQLKSKYISLPAIFLPFLEIIRHIWLVKFHINITMFCYPNEKYATSYCIIPLIQTVFYERVNAFQLYPLCTLMTVNIIRNMSVP